MLYAGRFATLVMSTLVASSIAFRPTALRIGRDVHTARFQVSKRCSRGGRSRHNPSNNARTMNRMLLGADTGIGILGISALGALRLLAATVAPKRVRVVTDIDDTVKSSGNKRLLGVPLGGIDAQYDRGVFYPGVFQFSLELSRHRVPSWQEPLPVGVLTARAREFLFALEINDTHEISREFRRCGERNGLKSWGRGPVLYGSVKEWICPSRKSERKSRNFGMLLENDGRGGRGKPGGAEGGYIFVGDTGEGDPLAGEMMSVEYPEQMRAVFLHVVSDAPTQGGVSVPADGAVNGVPVVYFRTYVGAAVKAVQLGLMDKAGLNNVIVAAKEALANVPLKSSKWVDINRDLAMALGTGQPRLPSLGVETVTLALADALVPKTKERIGAVGGQPALARTAGRGAGSSTKTRPRGA